MTLIRYPDWRNQNETTRYPFSAAASLSNGEQSIPQGALVDAALCPVGSRGRLYISRVEIVADTVTLHIGDSQLRTLATAVFTGTSPPELVAVTDIYGRPAGALVSADGRLGAIYAWGAGAFEFTADQTEFCASVCVARPDAGVTGIRLPNGDCVVGDVWIVGGPGVVLSYEPATRLPRDGAATAVGGVRVDVVGDPLYVRRFYEDAGTADLFNPSPYIKKIIITDSGDNSHEITPDEHGRVQIHVNGDVSAAPILRINRRGKSLVFSAVGGGARG